MYTLAHCYQTPSLCSGLCDSSGLFEGTR
ncbi:hypothetical protein NSPZN2_130015 [Nitrospira defluvii]|uniref:Uncharacterized protein n=1 Tax=Nitrospira defluvii TaxID=330214 RepID=A0ABM8R8N8_9BACT|nr:hypothetical protein NSPZN2_130015 [Nitrospira defluvii]